MDILDALNIIIDKIESNSSCGMLEEKVRKAKIILKNYVIDKLADEKDKENSNDYTTIQEK